MGKRLKFKCDVGFSNGLAPADLRMMAKADPKGFMDKMKEVINPNDESKSKLTLESFLANARANADALGDVPVEVEAVEGKGVDRRIKMIQSSAFPVLTSNLAVARLNAAYEEAPSVLDNLVTDMESDNKVDFVAGILMEEAVDVKGVPEGNDFPMIGAGEEAYQINHLRNGRKVELTAEAISENKAAGFVQRVSALGRIAAMIEERQGLRRITDWDGSATTPKAPYVLQNKDGTALYSTTANTPGTRTPSGARINNNALTDAQNLEVALTRLRGFKTDIGGPMNTPVSRMVLLVPQALEAIALQILGSQMTPGTLNEKSNWGPLGDRRPLLVSTPYLDEMSTTAWYMGNFKAQFIRKYKMRLETSVLGEGTQRFHDARIGFQMRAAWDIEFGAADYAYVVQNLSGTAAPQL